MGADKNILLEDFEKLGKVWPKVKWIVLPMLRVCLAIILWVIGGVCGLKIISMMTLQMAYGVFFIVWIVIGVITANIELNRWDDR